MAFIAEEGDVMFREQGRVGVDPQILTGRNAKSQFLFPNSPLPCVCSGSRGSHRFPLTPIHIKGSESIAEIHVGRSECA